jgi:hypothetical protein
MPVHPPAPPERRPAPRRPSYGPGWDAAVEYGIDVTLLEHNLRLSPTERLLQLQDMLNTYFALRPARGTRRDEPR